MAQRMGGVKGMRPRSAADAEVFTRRLGLEGRITPEVWLGEAAKLQGKRPVTRLADRATPEVQAVLEHPVVQKYLKLRPFMCPVEWPTKDLTRVMRDVTPFDVSYIFYDRRNGPIHGGRRYGPLLVAYASGMELRHMQRVTGLAARDLLEELLRQAEALWEKHVGFVFWALQVDYSRLHLFDFGSRTETLAKRLSYAAALDKPEIYVARQAFASWRKKNPALWERLRTGQYFKRKRRVRQLPKRGPKFDNRDLRCWPDAPPPHRNTVRYVRSRVW